METLSGPKPEGMMEATVTAAEGWPSQGSLSLLFPGEPSEYSYGSPSRLWAPTGTYTLEAGVSDLEDDLPKTVPVSVTDGMITKIHIQLDPNPITAGVSQQRSDQEAAWLNHQRARWGLPAGIVNVPIWSDACAAHDYYGYSNKILEHPEVPNSPGASLGGNWAGTHAVLAQGNEWAEEDNPWFDAPIHLNQVLTPSLSATGIDDSHGYQCLTTWPGLRREGVPTGTIFTFPGDGTVGLPPVETAGERPTTPNKVLGIPDKAGRQLFVYEEGTKVGEAPLHVLAASLQDQAGNKAAVKWLDQESSLGGYLTGAIIVPVEPLKPFTTYTATVTLAAFTTNQGVVVPQVTHTWSFTTGHENPDGSWSEPKPEREKPRGPQRKISAKWIKGQIIVKGWNFKKGKVVIKRKVLLKSKLRFNGEVMARAHVGAKGTFVASFHWPKRHISLRVYQDGKSTFGIYNPPHPPSWYRHHHKHG
jgi:hypothetical protein